MSLNKIEINDKIPRIMIARVANGFIVGIFPQNKDMEEFAKTYMQQFIGAMNTIEGDGWKNQLQDQIDQALGDLNGGKVKLYICKNAIEVMNLIAPQPENDLPVEEKLDLRWFWGNITNE